MQKMTKNQLLKFVKIRNESEFQTNLQFMLDLQQCGLSVKDFEGPRKVAEGHWEWDTPHGTLIEEHGEMRLEEK